MTEAALLESRIELANRSKWNLGYFWGGLIFWLYVTATGAMFPLSTAKVYWLVGTFLIFPTAVAVSRVIGADPFGKGNRLGELVGFTHMSVVTLSFPIVIAAFVYLPEALVLVMAIAYCIDFYVMSWAFGHRIFGLHAAIRVVVVTLVWFALPEWRMTVLPALVALGYLITVAVLPTLRLRWLRAHSVEGK